MPDDSLANEAAVWASFCFSTAALNGVGVHSDVTATITSALSLDWLRYWGKSLASGNLTLDELAKAVPQV